MNVVDLFCGGAGGWSLGLHRAGYRTIAAAEIHPWRRLVFGAKWGVPVCDDVRKVTGSWFREQTGIDRPFLVCGSPPCKEYSAANSGGRGLDTDDLFLEAVRVVSELGPAWAAFENSPRVRTLGYDRIAYEMEAIGFACWPVVVGLANAGAAHRRQRLWLLCANRASQQGWSAGQPREASGLRPDAGSANGSQEGAPGSRGWWQRRAEGGGSILSDRDGPGLWIEHGRRCGPNGHQAPISFEPSAILGPVGTPVLGSSIREYDGLSAGLAELCRAAYGDAVGPIIPEIIGRAIMTACRSQPMTSQDRQP